MKDIDPTPDQRHYMRHVRTGERGYIVQRGGVDKVRLDRPQEIVLPKDDQWKDDYESAQFTLHQVARVAFAADRQLLAFMGRYLDAKKEWTGMKEAARIAWVKDGPFSEKRDETSVVRQRVFLAIMDELRELAK